MAKLTPKKKAKFLKLLSEGYSVSNAADAICMSRQALYQTKKQDEEFEKDWLDAIESGTDLLEDEARRRAHDGTDKPVFFKGEECGKIREYSDTLLIFLLKGRRPEKYRENINHSGEVTTTPTLTVIIDGTETASQTRDSIPVTGD